MKYNFKKFFDDNKIANNEWVSNGHFAIKRSALKKSHNTFVDTFPDSHSRAESISSIVEKSISEFYKYNSMNDTEFIPTLYNSQGFKGSNGILLPAVINENNIAINEEYYNFIKDLHCKLIYNKEQETYKPLLIFDEDSEIVGIVLPVRIEHTKILEAIDYNTYLNKLATEKEQAKEAKQNQKKCLYISNNKAVIRRKDLTCIAELVNDSSFKNLYVESDYKKDGGKVFIDFGFVLMYIGYLGRYDVEPETIKYRLEKMKDFTIDDYKQYITECLNNNQFINVAEIKLMELAGESPEYIQTLKDHRQKVIDMRERERVEEETKKQAEEQEYIIEQNNKAEALVINAEQAILNKQPLKNIEITFYQSRYNSNTTSIINYLMKKYNITVPLKTQGWINRALSNIQFNEEYGWSYNYYTSSADSTVFMKYLKELVNKVKSN
jgi:hypothetical protein